MANLEYPSINAATLPGQMEQVRRYLYQFAERLNFALATIEKGKTSGGIQIVNAGGGAVEAGTVSTFNELKSLIISSADIVQHFAAAAKRIYDGSGSYVAQSDFGTYQELIRTILDTDTENGVTLLMTKEERIETDEEGLQRKYRGCIRIGKVTLPKDEREVYGVCVGQMTEINGVKKYTASARYRSDGVDFYDAEENRVAYIKTTELGGEQVVY